MRRFLTAAGLAVLAVAVAAPAWAHEEINPAAITTGRPVFFLFSAANEEKADLVKITLAAPAGTPFGATTREPQGWTAEASEAAITWSGGAVKPGKFEQWGFEIEGADQPGALSYKVALGFADGKTTNVEVVVAATAAAEGSVTPTSTGDAGLTATVTTAKPPTGTAAASTSDRTARGRANLAVAIGAIAILVAVASAFRRPRRTGQVSGNAATPTTPGQDW